MPRARPAPSGRRSRRSASHTAAAAIAALMSAMARSSRASSGSAAARRAELGVVPGEMRGCHREQHRDRQGGAADPGPRREARTRRRRRHGRRRERSPAKGSRSRRARACSPRRHGRGRSWRRPDGGGTGALPRRVQDQGAPGEARQSPAAGRVGRPMARAVRRRPPATPPPPCSRVPGWTFSPSSACSASSAPASLVSTTGAVFRPGEWYERLAKPRWRPPNWVFAPAWAVLYLCIAVSGWLVWREAGGRGRGRAGLPSTPCSSR